MDESTGVLIFTPRRDIRRAAFDALDVEGDFVLLSARDATQLEALLADEPPLHVVVFGADGSADMAQGLRILRASSRYASVPVVHVVDDVPGVAPGGVAHWLREGSIGVELAQRVRAAVRAPEPVAEGPRPPDWRFAFDAGAA